MTLLDTLQKAEAGSRELDAAVWLWLNRPEYKGSVRALEMRTWYDGAGHLILETDAGEEVADRLYIGAYTTSMDAALALVERVLPGWKWDITTLTTSVGGISHPEAFVCPPDLPGGAEITAVASAPTPPLALVIALVRAKEEM